MTPETEITVALTLVEWNVIGNALAELPFKISAPLIQKINTQMQPLAPPSEPELAAS